MTHQERFPDRHPLCTCPEGTFAYWPTAADREECRRRSVADTHPVVEITDLLPYLTVTMTGATPA